MSEGRAPWLPSLFIQAIHAARGAINEEELAHTERMKQKHQRGPVPVRGGAYG